MGEKKKIKGQLEGRSGKVLKLLHGSDARSALKLPTSYAGTVCSTEKLILSVGLCQGGTMEGANDFNPKTGSRYDSYKCVYKDAVMKKPQGAVNAEDQLGEGGRKKKKKGKSKGKEEMVWVQGKDHQVPKSSVDVACMKLGT